MGFASDLFADLVEMELHGLSVGKRQHESSPCATGRANSPEQIGVLITLISRK